MTSSRDAEAEVRSAVAASISSGLFRDPRLAVDFGEETVSIKHIESGQGYLLEYRLMPLGRVDGDG